MKLLRYGQVGSEKPCVLDEVFHLSGRSPDLGDECDDPKDRALP
jgi:hypothetical protein